MSGDSTLILTPTARLARAEKLQQAKARSDQGKLAWVQPPVATFSGWVSQIRDDWFLAGDDDRVPITPGQALVLWQEVIDRDIFIGEPRVAEMAAGAWRLIHEFQLQAPEQWPALLQSEDSRQFRGWVARFRALCEQRSLVDEWTFAAELPGLIAENRIELPEHIRLSGFDLPMTPIQQAIIAAAESAGCRMERTTPSAPAGEPIAITAFADADDELRAAARWARARLEQNARQTLAVVVPDLRERLGRVERIFRQVFDRPGFSLFPGGQEAWHVSLGPPLAKWPLVADALAILRLDPHRISQPEAGGLLRSPYLTGAVEEQHARADTLAALARHKPYWIHAGELAWQAGACKAVGFSPQLAEWEASRREYRDPALPSAWVARFQKELKAIGFGRGRSLDSREYQVLQQFHDLLEAFSALDLVITRPLGRRQALQRLSESAGTGAFRERNPGTPVEILGVEEALGSRFDAIWITTLDNRSWPKPARRDPLIPGALQLDVPGATGDGSLERARRELEGLARASDEIRGSFATGSGDDLVTLTPLLAGCPINLPEADSTPEPVTMEILPDDTRAPAFTGDDIGGGTSVLQRQSDCPFRAFAERRLGAADLTPPRPGIDAAARGSLVHKALEQLWQGLDGRAALQALNDTALEARIDQACQAALEWFTRHRPLALSDAGRELESQCLKRSLRRWLALEAERDDFTVTATESKVELKTGGLRLSGTIDRIDEIEGGGSVVIDYKTGISGRNGWAPDRRLADVQLPAYAVSMNPAPVAISFARLRPDAMGFDGLAEVDIGTSGVEVIGQIKRSKFKHIDSWQALVADWQTSLDQLAGDFCSGHAEVDPREPRVCDYCHLHSLCRINERQWTDTDKEGNAE